MLLLHQPSATARQSFWLAERCPRGASARRRRYGNNVTHKASFDATTGRLNSATAGIGSATNVLNTSYAWDSLNHLSGRTDANGDGSTGAVTYSQATRRMT